MHEAHISQVELAIDAANHELRLPQLLVVRDVVVTGFTLSDLEDCSVSFDVDFDVFQFFSVDGLELKLQSLVWDGHRFEVHVLSDKIAALEVAMSLKS